MNREQYDRAERAIRGCWRSSPLARKLGGDRADDAIGEVMLAIVEAGGVEAIADVGAFAYGATRRVIARMFVAEHETSEPSIYSKPEQRAIGKAWLEAVEDAMVRAGGFIPKAARSLGVSESTVKRTLAELPDVIRAPHGGKRPGAGRPKKAAA